MKKVSVILLLLNVFHMALGQSDVEFSMNETHYRSYLWNVIVDKNDNIITTGDIKSLIYADKELNVGSSLYVNKKEFKLGDTTGLFLVKMDKQKEVLWFKNIKSKSIILANVLADDSSNIYIVGRFQQMVKFDESNVLTSATEGVFVAKYTSDGIFKWAKKYIGNSDNISFNAKIDSQNNLYIIGRYQNSLEVADKQVLKAIGEKPESYILKLDSNGNYIWSKSFNENLDLNAISVNNKNEIFITGDFEGSIELGQNIKIQSLAMKDIFYAKYDKNGQILWAKTIAGTSMDKCHTIEADNDGNIYMAGVVSDEAKFDSLKVNLKTERGFNIFLAKITSNNGQISWVRNIIYGKEYAQITSDVEPNTYSFYNEAKILKLNNLGEPYLFGTVKGFLNVKEGGVNFIADYREQIEYLIKYDRNGTFMYITKDKSFSDQYGIYISNSIAIDSKRNIYFTGNYFPFNGKKNSYISFLRTKKEFYDISCDEKIGIVGQYGIVGVENSGLINSYFNYQWYKNGVVIPNATKESFETQEAGYYSLRLTNTTNSSCQVSSSNSINILPLALSTPAILNFNGLRDPYLYTDGPVGDKIEWYFNDKLIKTTTTPFLYDISDGVYKIKKYFANNTIIKESNEVNIQRNLGVCISKEIIYDNGDVCQPMPYLKINLAGNPILSKTGGVQVTWYLNGEIIKDSTDVHLKVVKPGDYKVRLVMDNPLWDFISGKYKIVVEDFPKSLPITKIEEICGAKALLKVDDSFMQRFSFLSAIWRVDDKVISEATQPFYTANKSGFYTFSVQYKENTIGKICTYNSSINFEKKNDFKLNLGYAYAGSGCVVDSFKVFTEQNPKYTYTWTKNDVPIEKQTTNEIFVKDKARYKGIVRRDDGCVNETDEISLKGCTSDDNEKFLLINPPKITADKTSFFTGEKALLSLVSCPNVNLRWLKNGQIIGGTNQQNLEVKEEGDYTLQIEKLGCTATTNTIKISVETILAVGEENTDYKIEVFPNPTEEKLYVSIPSQINTPIGVKMTNISGKLISNYDFSASNSQFIDLKAFQEGVYLLIIEIGDKRVIKKIVKKN